MEVPETQPNPYLCTSLYNSSTECERKHDNCVGARHACALIEDFLEFLDSIPSPKVPVKLSAEVQERISREVEEEMKMLFEEFEENVAIPNLETCQIGNKMGDENFPPIILRNGEKGSERETPEKERPWSFVQHHPHNPQNKFPFGHWAQTGSPGGCIPTRPTLCKILRKPPKIAPREGSVERPGPPGPGHGPRMVAEG